MTRKNVYRQILSILSIIILICSGILIIIHSDQRQNTVKAERTWTQTSESDFNNGTMNNLTILGNEEEAKLEIELSDIKQWIEKKPSTKPSARNNHQMAPIYGTEKILLFGGLNLNDTWVYDLKNNTWTKKNPENNGDTPSSRYYFALASIWGDDKVLLFGGYGWSGSWIFLDDTWVYDLSLDKWEKKYPSGIVPSPRTYHAMADVYGDDKVLLFGGSPSWNNYLDDTYVYDLGLNSWTKMNPQSNGNIPSARNQLGMAANYGHDKMTLFGGYSSSGNLGDTWVYDLSDDKWTDKNPLGNKPGNRYMHNMASIYTADNVVLFGGRVNWAYKNDTWTYDLNNNKWTEKISAISPSLRILSAMTGVYGTDKAVLFGGQYSGYKDDTWIYKHFLDTRNGTYVSGQYDAGSNSSFLTISWNAKIHEYTNITFQVRTANSLANLNNQDFVGPDGTASSYYTTSPSSIWSGHTGDRWIQYKAYLNISIYTHSPTLRDVWITYNCLPKTIVISPVSGSLLTNNKPTFRWTFEDLDSDGQKAFQVLIDDNITFSDVDFNSGEQSSTEQHWDFPTGTNYNEIPEGHWYWKIRTRDQDQVWTEFGQPWEFDIDTLAPSSAPSVPINKGFYNKLIYTSGIASDFIPGSGINKIEIAIKRESDNHYWDGLGWVQLTKWLLALGTTEWIYDTSSITWESGMRYGIQSRAADNATNIELPGSGNTFTIDMEKPISSVELPKDNTWVNNLDVISGSSFDKGGSGIKKNEINIYQINEKNYWNGTHWDSGESWLSLDGLARWSLNTESIPWATGGQYRIRSRAIDNATNLEEVGLGTTFMYDDQPPEPISILIKNGDDYTQSAKVTVSLQAEDLGSGVYQMSFSIDNITWSAWEPFNNTRYFDIPVGDGEKSIYLKVLDYAGNIAKPVVDTIVLDTTPPRELAISINEGDLYTTSPHVDLKLHATDFLSGVGDMTLSLDGIEWTSWEKFLNTRFLSLTNEEGKKLVYFNVRDNAGNTADPIFESIVLDTKPPYSLSISINDGATDTNSTFVKLNVDARDNTSGVDQISFSTDAENWTDWEPFSLDSSITLPPDDGEKIIYLRVKDHAGNIANPVSATISLKTPESEKETETLTQKGSIFGLEFWILLIIIIIIIIGIFSVVVISRRKRRLQQQLLPQGTLTIRPGALSTPIISTGQVPATLRLEQLPSSITGSGVPPPNRTATPIPILAKSTQFSPEYMPHPSHPQQVPQPLPQLPPAQFQETKPKVQGAAPITPGPAAQAAVLAAQAAVPATTSTQAAPPTTLNQAAPMPTTTGTPSVAQAPGTSTTVSDNSSVVPSPKVFQDQSTPQTSITTTPTLAQTPGSTAAAQGPAVHLPGTMEPTTQDTTTTRPPARLGGQQESPKKKTETE